MPSAQISRDASIVPTQELDLPKIVLGDDNAQSVNLAALAFEVLFLMVRADGDFHEGADTPDPANDLWREGSQVWFIPVSGRSSWKFIRRAGSPAVTVYLKALGAR